MKLSTSSWARWRAGSFVGIGVIAGAFLIAACAGSTADEPPPGGLPEEINTLERKGYDFQWQADHWESREMSRDTVFYYYPYGLGEFERGFGYTSSIDLLLFDDPSIVTVRRDFFEAFGVDTATEAWSLQLARSILTEGETGGRACRGNLCCLFTYDYPEYRFYCIPN